uniref:Glycosyl transferase, family 2 n=1 Tax=Paulinella longichromatophora TaxID=1708747 RepID=A0A2H4ZPG8_9EUKA|nr:Glycosyl transferase, family 2 [Paulinella longichromatophora]
MTAIGTTTYRRRSKAAFFLLFCSWGGIFPHYLHGLRSFLPTAILTILVGGYNFYAVILQVYNKKQVIPNGGNTHNGKEFLPTVDIIIAARDEESVILKLVNNLAELRYPTNLLHFWIIDDGSQDHTPQLLTKLKKDLPNLQVIHRTRGSGGGKSGALNTVFDQLKSDWCMILDADAQLQFDVLERLIHFAENGGWSAVQLRKAVNNTSENFLTKAQSMEMALDATIQQGRLRVGGIVELRGNGQLFKRKAVELSGGFNEATVTDDLDLTFRLLLAKQSIGILWDPPVQEEAVLTLTALWRQRQRWAEGGLQRFFDYGEGLFSSRLNLFQKYDLIMFFVIQYVLPVVSLVDLITSIITHTFPVYWPLSIASLILAGIAIAQSCQQLSEGPPLPKLNPLNISLGIIYLAHWLFVIPWVALRMAFLPKYMIWAKTLHHGDTLISPKYLVSQVSK